MIDQACSLLSCGPDEDREWTMADYESAAARWCPGCGDHAILTAAQRLLESGFRAGRSAPRGWVLLAVPFGLVGDVWFFVRP